MHLMPQRTKIVATVGPATESPEIIKDLLESGVSVFRMNLKHNTHDWHARVIKRIRNTASSLGMPISIITDLQGPELRTEDLPAGIDSLMLEVGQKVILSKNALLQAQSPENIAHIPFNHCNLIHNLKKNNFIYIDDGKITLKAERVTSDFILAMVKEGSELGSRKSISVPDAHINVPALTERDNKDVKFAIENDADYIALSFVRGRGDIATLSRLISKTGGQQKIIAKIETVKAIENFDEILNESDAIMFARGDLGIEIPIERLPKLQKMIIQKCRQAAKPVIVATQMLQSMKTSPQPTRAEVADIANAVFDKTDALMLSDETTVGKYPVKAVRMMSKIARYNEEQKIIDTIEDKMASYEEVLIAASLRFMTRNLEQLETIGGYLVFTESGRSARLLSRYHPPVPVFAFTTHQAIYHQLCLSFGVRPFYMPLGKNPAQNIKNAVAILKKSSLISSGQKLIVIFGNNVGAPAANNNLSVIKV